jgi:hypothetical protein
MYVQGIRQARVLQAPPLCLTGVRTFVNRGNTVRARAQARNNVAWENTPHVGRVPNANSAWNRM